MRKCDDSVESCERNIVALARMMASEIGDAFGKMSHVAKAAVAHAALTMANERHVSVAELLMPGGAASAQNTGGRYASTRLAPSIGDLRLASDILSGKVQNPTPGATMWDSPDAQDALVKRNTRGYRYSSEQVAKRRKDAGMEQVVVQGIPVRRLRLWRRKVSDA